MTTIKRMELLEKKNKQEGLTEAEKEWLVRQYTKSSWEGAIVFCAGIIAAMYFSFNFGILNVNYSLDERWMIVIGCLGAILLGNTFFLMSNNRKTAIALSTTKEERQRQEQERRRERTKQGGQQSQPTAKAGAANPLQDAGNLTETAEVEQLIITLETTHQELADVVNQATLQGFHDVQEASESWWGNRNLRKVLARKTANFQQLGAMQGAIKDYLNSVTQTLDILTEFYKKTGQTHRLPFIDRKRAELDHARIDADIAQEQARKAEAQVREAEARRKVRESETKQDETQASRQESRGKPDDPVQEAINKMGMAAKIRQWKEMDFRQRAEGWVLWTQEIKKKYPPEVADEIINHTERMMTEQGFK